VRIGKDTSMLGRGLARLARRVRGQNGFALTEAVIAMSLFLVLAVGMEATLASSVVGHQSARERTTGDQLASARVETIRRLPYDSVGTTSGNPPGTLEPLRTETIDGVNYRVRTRVTYMDDPVPSGYITRANYKRVLVVVTELSTGRELARHETYVAPPTAPLRNRAIVRAYVYEAGLNAAVGDVPVALETGPSAPRNDTTQPDGWLTFPQLLPNPASGPQGYYDVRVTPPAGYEVLREHVPPAPAVHVRLAAGQTSSPTIGIYRPATIDARLTDAAGNPYLQSAIVTVVGIGRDGEDFPVTGGLLSVPRVAGERLPPVRYRVSARSTTGGLFAAGQEWDVVPTYPSLLSQTFTLALRPYTTASLVVRVRRNGSPVANARVLVSGGAGSVGLYGVTPSNGNLTFTVPNSGTYTAEAWPTGGTSRTATGTIGTGVTVSLP
jgi:hypothetical protein